MLSPVFDQATTILTHRAFLRSSLQNPHFTKINKPLPTITPEYLHLQNRFSIIYGNYLITV